MADEINKTTGGDITHSLIKGAFGAVSYIGSLAAEIFCIGSDSSFRKTESRMDEPSL